MSGDNGVRVSVVGLGMMGSALAGAYLRAGHPTTVWNRSASRADPLVEQGARRADTIADAVAASDLLVVCVVDYRALYEIFEPVREALDGKTIVNLTSGVPEDARGAARWAQSLRASYLDGCLLTVPPAVGLPQTLLFYGGPAEVFDTYESTLKVLGGNSVLLGADPGVASLYDLSLLGILWSSLAGALHGFAMLTAEGVPAAALTPFVGSWITHVVLPSITGAARQVDAGRYATDISTVGLNAAGLAKLVEASRGQGIRPDVMVPIRDMLRERAGSGHGDEALASMIEVIRRPRAAAS
ncbi:NAD(P)-dependent oxidoreductase [Micromonospora antibiotica]|uniref:NAD(P)-dependent oxidoreductase n=1 Tax=Micromonospora antibiotica TaxID=2807623 RepID=A0ABS3V8E7_9ACTN|nr:NAD(P)-binding domain-containing protein [Micromonospora antibiotica]MBO4161883.1 NAD(P)-dependent oxidoreductase [Micromonospora antibiotica]